MEKTYNGAALGLPERDEDLFRAINEKTARRRESRERLAASEKREARRDAQGAMDARYTRVRGDLDLSKARPWVAAVIMFVLALWLGRMM